MKSRQPRVSLSLDACCSQSRPSKFKTSRLCLIISCEILTATSNAIHHQLPSMEGLQCNTETNACLYGGHTAFSIEKQTRIYFLACMFSKLNDGQPNHFRTRSSDHLSLVMSSRIEH